MPLVRSNFDIGNIATWDDARRFIAQALNDITQAVNGNIEPTINLKAQLLEANFSAADTNLTLNHGLGRNPQGYILVKSSAATSLYDGSIAASSANITLKSSSICNVSILLF